MDLTSKLRPHFPNITDHNYQHTSQPTPSYNCIAWAAGINNRWWEPDSSYFYYWPPGVEREYTLNALVAAYQAVGYEICEDGEAEDGFEKLVIYVDADDTPLHAARLLADGNWTSKLGPSIDISHVDPSVLEGSSYGNVSTFMKRPSTNNA